MPKVFNEILFIPKMGTKPERYKSDYNNFHTMINNIVRKHPDAEILTQKVVE